MIDLKNICVSERTEWMYKVLRDLDKFNVIEWNEDSIRGKEEFLITYFQDLIDWVEWEVWCLKKTEQLRERELELTTEIENLFFYDSKLEDLREILAVNSSKKTAVKSSSKNRSNMFMVVGSLINKLEKRFNRLMELKNSISQFGVILVDDA